VLPSGTPAALRADTSAEIVFNYLDAPDAHVGVDGVSNNHFDEDGLIGIFALMQPALAAVELLPQLALSAEQIQELEFGRPIEVSVAIP